MGLVLFLAAFLGIYTGLVSSVPQLSIEPNVVFNGKPTEFTCTTNNESTRAGVLIYRGTRLDPSPVKAVLATLVFKTKKVTIRAPRVKAKSSAVTSATQTLVVEYDQTECGADAHKYSCAITLALLEDPVWGPPQTLTIIDLKLFNVTSLKLSDPRQCPEDTDQTECDLCDPLDTSIPVRNKGDKLTFECESDLVFPSERPNTFRWFINDIDGDWQPLSNEDSPSRKTATTTPAPNTPQSFCYNSTETHEHTLDYTPEGTDPRMLQVRCEVTFEYKGLTQKREKVMSLCIIGGMEPTATTTTTKPKKTTPKTEGKDNSGFSLTTGPGIALLTACVVVAAVGGVGFWFYRRQHRAPAQDNADEYYADGGENYT